MAALETERSGGLRHVPAVLLQLAENEFTFISAACFVKRGIGMMRTLGDAAKEFGGEVVRLDARLGTNDDQALHEIPKFANVSRPGIEKQNLHGCFTELACFLAVRRAELPEK